MTTEIALRNQATDLAITGEQTFWNDKQIAALQQLGVKDFTNGDLAVFFHQCAKTGLDPFAKQIYMISRWTKDGPRQTIQTGIDGFRLIARRAADRAGESLEYADTLWCGTDGVWHDAWLVKRPPAAAKVGIIRAGKSFSAVAVWDEFVQTIKSGEPNSMWARMPSNQLAKCAEALALRKAFPQDLSGIYTDDELGHGAKPEAQTRVTSADILPLAAPAEPVYEPSGMDEFAATTDVELPIAEPAGWEQ